MGLIKAGIGALGGTLADQWKEFFTCDALSMDVLVVRGQKQTSKRSSNKKGNDNVRERLSSSAPNRENIHMIHLPNRVCSREISEAALKPCSRRWEDGFSTAEIQEKIREYIM